MTYRISAPAPSWLFTAAVIVGYASFRAANSSIYLSRFSQSPESFIFMTDPVFNVASALATVLCALVVIALCAAGKLKDFSMPVTPAVAILLFGIGAVAVDESALPFEGAALVFSVVAFSIGSIMLKMAWIELFAHEAPQNAIIQIACASLASAGLQYVLSTAEAAATTAITVVLLVANAFLLLFARRCALGGDGRAAACARTHDERDAQRGAFAEIRDALLTLCVLEAAIGLINSFMLAASMTFSGAASVPSMAMAIAAGLFCFAALITRRLPAASATFRVAFPVLAAMVAFVPFASDGYSRIFSTVLLVSYDFVALLLLYQVSYASHKFKVSSYALMALFSGCTKLCLLIALIAGGIFGGHDAESSPSTVRFLVLSCGVIYLLAMAVIVLSRDRKKKAAHGEGGAAWRIAANASPDSAGMSGNADAASETPGARREEGADDPGVQRDGESEKDPFEETCALLAAQHGLTGREVEILGHLARGRTNTRIAEDLCISPATVRGHIRHIYTKLDVHDRQELIDLFQ